VQTQYGWHIVKVLERDPDRPLSELMLQALRGQALSRWLDEQRRTSTIRWHLGLTPLPTPAVQPFVAPPDAPLTPTLTLTPTTVPETPTVEVSPTATPLP